MPLWKPPRSTLHGYSSLALLGLSVGVQKGQAETSELPPFHQKLFEVKISTMTTSGKADEEDIQQLGQQAFSVFCDVAARDISMECEALSQENSRLRPIYDKLTTLQFFQYSRQVSSLDITGFVAQDATHYYYELDNGFDITDDGNWWADLAGALFGPPYIKFRQSGVGRDAFLEHDLVPRVMTVKGKLCTKRRRSPEAVCHVKTVIIRKSVVDNMLGLGERPSQENPMSYVQELENVYHAHPSHRELREAFGRYQSTFMVYKKMKAARDNFETVIGAGADGPVFRMKLQDGQVGRPLFNYGDFSPTCWRLAPKNPGPISSGGGFSVALGGTDPASVGEGRGYMDRRFEQGFVMAFLDSPVEEAIFLNIGSPLESLIDDEAYETFLERVLATLGDHNSDAEVQAKCVLVHFRLGFVRERLNDLGCAINTAAIEE